MPNIYTAEWVTVSNRKQDKVLFAASYQQCNKFHGSSEKMLMKIVVLTAILAIAYNINANDVTDTCDNDNNGQITEYACGMMSNWQRSNSLLNIEILLNLTLKLDLNLGLGGTSDNYRGTLIALFLCLNPIIDIDIDLLSSDSCYQDVNNCKSKAMNNMTENDSSDIRVSVLELIDLSIELTRTECGSGNGGGSNNDLIDANVKLGNTKVLHLGVL